MINLILSISLFLNIYSLPIAMEKAPNYDKKMETVEQTEDLERINTRFFNREPVKFKKLMPGEDLAESGKGSTIYFAYANDGTPLAVVKQLPIEDSLDKQEMEDEISSLHERYFRNTKHFKVPRLIGTAEFASEEEANGYIIESIAQGKSINTLVKETGSSSGSHRYKKFQTLKHGVKKTALSFAEFHQLKSYSSYSNYYKEEFYHIKKTPFEGPYGIIHGDAHLGNIFYNPKTDKTTFIDLSFMPLSLKGAPVGVDSGKFIFTLEALCTFYGLTNAETNELRDLYIDTYLAANPKMNAELMEEYIILCYKDFSFESEGMFSSDKTDQGSFLYRFAAKKVNALSTKHA
ncbi:MAG: hypothetical protein S4CHLAM20_00230 [Chlamydiia bacterium]|nr:hypothetical protein [Chlamydiia bacterium]